MKILFLYTELSEYFLACVNTLLVNKNVEIHIVTYPINAEAPFIFNFPEKIKIYNRNDFNLDTIVNLYDDFCPDIVFCSGWKDRAYLSLCKMAKIKTPVILCFDNKWNGSIKQRIGSLFNKITIHKYFSHCWIPGKPQIEFANRLGFSKNNILTGFYSCDYAKFSAFNNLFSPSKKKIFPHRFIFAGRYVESKGVNDLWRAFIELQNKAPNDWELYCIGTGNIEPTLHPKIKHFGFVQPTNLYKLFSDTGVFILPSRFEPWGVAVHEFASAGFPIICSHEVGAADIFLMDGKNGFSFKSGNVQELKSAMRKIISLTDQQLFLMGEKSAELAKRITPEKWSDTLMSILK